MNQLEKEQLIAESRDSVLSAGSAFGMPLLVFLKREWLLSVRDFPTDEGDVSLLECGLAHQLGS